MSGARGPRDLFTCRDPELSKFRPLAHCWVMPAGMDRRTCRWRSPVEPGLYGVGE